MVNDTLHPILRIFCIAVLALMSGCSTFSGEKLGIKDNKSVEPTGIPYVLVRPEYTLTRTPPADGQKLPTYTIGVSYEADWSQRYSLNINPGLFVNPDFIMKLGAGGTLTGTTTTLTEQVTPTVTALGSFAKDFVGALATGALDKDSVRNQIKSALDGPNCEACKAASDIPRLSIPPGGNPPTVKDTINKRLDAFKDDDEFANLFHYVTEKERLCLIDANKSLDIIVTKEHKINIEKWEKERVDYLSKNPGDKVFLERLTRSVTLQDTKGLNASYDEISKETDPVRKENRSALFASAGPAARGKAGTEALAKLDFFINMDSPTWRARNLLYLERELDRVALLVLREPNLAGNPSVDNYVELLRRQRAATIGVVKLYERSMVLSKFLEDIKNKAVCGGMAPAVAEYGTARAELDAVSAQIDAQRTRVLADAKPTPPPAAPPLSKIPLPMVSQQFVEESNKASDWIFGKGAKAPDYVLVVEEVPLCVIK